MTEAWFGLLGVVVGSVLTQGLALLIEWRRWVREDRNRDRERLRAAVITLVESSGKAAFSTTSAQAREPWERMSIAHSEIYVLGSERLVMAALRLSNLAQNAMNGDPLETSAFTEAQHNLCSVGREELGLSPFVGAGSEKV